MQISDQEAVDEIKRSFDVCKIFEWEECSEWPSKIISLQTQYVVEILSSTLLSLIHFYNQGKDISHEVDMMVFYLTIDDYSGLKENEEIFGVDAAQDDLEAATMINNTKRKDWQQLNFDQRRAVATWLKCVRGWNKIVIYSNINDALKYWD